MQQYYFSRYQCNLCGHVAFDISKITAHFSVHQDSSSCSGKYTVLETSRWHCPLNGCAGNVMWQGSSIRKHLKGVHSMSLDQFVQENGLDKSEGEEDIVVDDGPAGQENNDVSDTSFSKRKWYEMCR